MRIKLERKEFHVTHLDLLISQIIFNSLKKLCLYLGKFLIFEKKLERIKSLSLVESKQLIDIVCYLFERHIIHRDVRPQNLMVDWRHQHLKLIDFGFAIIHKTDEKICLPVAGTITYGSYEFLKHCMEKLNEQGKEQSYNYEETFDLTCAINIIMYMNDTDVKNKIKPIQELKCLKIKASEALKTWQGVQQENNVYSNLLNLINKLTKSTDFKDIKEQLEKLKFFNK